MVVEKDDFHPLCYEHHVEMRLQEDSTAYACSMSSCQVRYARSDGYFIVAQNGQIDRDLVPHVICPQDGQPMYLAEVGLGKTNFRLWRCPQCAISRSNQEISRKSAGAP